MLQASRGEIMPDLDANLIMITPKGCMRTPCWPLSRSSLLHPKGHFLLCTADFFECAARLAEPTHIMPLSATLGRCLTPNWHASLFRLALTDSLLLSSCRAT